MVLSMPLFDFECTACRTRFEEIVRMGDAPKACPSCGGLQVKRLLAALAPLGGRATERGDGGAVGNRAAAHACGKPGCC